MENNEEKIEDESVVSEPKENKKPDYLLPASIVIAALLIAGAWVYSAGLKNLNPGNSQAGVNNAPQVGQTANPNDPIPLKPVASDDHIQGNPDAPVKIVEFSDLECPFCKRFNETMRQVMADYGNAGKVAWVYRSYPIDSLHPINGRKAAEAAECAAELGGKEAFWTYVEKYFATTRCAA